jgi:hypothetical protein
LTKAPGQFLRYIKVVPATRIEILIPVETVVVYMEREINVSSLASEIGKFLSTDNAKSLDKIVEKTSAESRSDAKSGLRELMDAGCITTTPGFKYRLSRSNLSEPFKD